MTKVTPLFWTVTGRDFGRSIAWARTWRNPIRLHAQAVLAKINPSKK
jgi:hypothetical protein